MNEIPKRLTFGSIKRNAMRGAAGSALVLSAPALAVELDASRVTTVQGVEFQRVTDVSSFAIDEATGAVQIEFSGGVIETYAKGTFQAIGGNLYLNPAAIPIPAVGFPSIQINPAATGAGLAALAVLSGGSVEGAVGDDGDDAPTPITPNDPPVWDDGLTTAETINENTSGAIFTVSATDPDNDTLTYTLDAQSRSEGFTISGGTVSHAGLDFEEDSSHSVTVSASDGTGNVITHTVVITVQGVDEAPVFSDGATRAVSVAENATGTLFTASATDPEGDDITYSLDGVSQTNGFSIDGSGNVTFSGTLDADTGPGTYTIEVTATAGGLTTTQTVTVTITGVNEAPVFSNGTTRTVSVAEDATGTLFTSNASDPEGESVTFSLDQASIDAGFTIDGSGNVSFSGELDADTAPTSYTIVVTASDGTNQPTQTVTLNLTGVEEAPFFDNGSSRTVDVAENATGTLFTSNASDPEGGSVTLSLDQASIDAGFSIDGSGNVTYSGTPFDADTAPTSYTLTITANDGTSQSTQTVTLNLTGVNEAPVFNNGTSDGTVNLEENSDASQVVFTADVSDPESDSLSYSLTGTDAGLFSVDSDGSVTLKSGGSYDHETKDSYDFTVVVAETDTPGNTDSFGVTVTVADVNEAPVFSVAGPVNQSIQTDHSGVIYTPSASDEDKDPADTLLYTLSGPSAASFSVDGGTGAVTVASGVTLAAGVYDVTLTVSDQQSPALTDTLDLVITVSADNTAPVIDSVTTGSLSETTATTDVVHDASATDSDTGDTLVFSLGTGTSDGADHAKFTIDADDGKIRPNSAFDWENLDDADQDGVYEVTVIVSDGTDTDSKLLKLTLSDIAEVSVPSLHRTNTGSPWIASDTGYSNASQDALQSLILSDRGQETDSTYYSWLGYHQTELPVPSSATTAFTYAFNDSTVTGALEMAGNGAWNEFGDEYYDALAIDPSELFTWTTAEKNAFSAIFDDFAAVGNVTFTETTPKNVDFELLLGKTNIEGLGLPIDANVGFGAFAYFPWFGETTLYNPSTGESSDAMKVGGDALFVLDNMGEASTDTVLNSIVTEFGDSSLTSETYQRSTVVHELLHALGVMHPFDGGGTGDGPGTDYGHLSTEADNLIETVMTYHRPWYELPDEMGVEDVRAFQFYFGPNLNTNSGDTTYTFDESDPQVFDTIWDAGGNDTIMHVGNSSAVIDLRDGEYSALGHQPEAYPPYVVDLDGENNADSNSDGDVLMTYDGVTYDVGRFDLNMGYGDPYYYGFSQTEVDSAVEQAKFNVGIAHGVTIENATGGDGDDTISGNSAPNKLNGGAGDDELTGGGAADVFRFDADWGNDVITDFNPVLDFLEFDGALNEADINISQASSDTIVTYGDDQITLTGVDMSLLNSGVNYDLV